MILSGASVTEVRFVLQSCLNYVYKWCITNRLYMKMKKTKTMWFETIVNNAVFGSDYDISIKDTTLSRVCSYQYLGVELDDVLSYDKQLENVVNKATHKLYVFRKIRRFISQSTAITVYKLMVLPLLEYCSILFKSGKKSRLDKVEKIQSKCIHIIKNCTEVSMRSKQSVLCCEYGLETLQTRRDTQL